LTSSENNNISIFELKIDNFKKRELTMYPIQKIQSKIMVLPDRPPFMIDEDVAGVYGISTKKLNQAVNRNPERFPEDFRFQLTHDDVKKLNLEKKVILRSQSVTSSWGGRRTLPWAYTREGCHMISTVLNTPRAIDQSIIIIRAFSALEQFAEAAYEASNLLQMILLVHNRLERIEKKIDNEIYQHPQGKVVPLFKGQPLPTQIKRPRKYRKVKHRFARMGVEEEVKFLLEAERTYKEIAAILIEMGVKTSKSAVQRYAMYLQDTEGELKPKSQEVQEFVVYLRDHKGLTYQEIAEKLKFSRQRAHQIHQEATTDTEPTARIKYLLTQRGEKANAFAERIGYKYQTVLAVINQRSKGRAVRAAIAKGLGLEYFDLWRD